MPIFSKDKKAPYRPLPDIWGLHFLASLLTVILWVADVPWWAAILVSFLPVHLAMLWATLNPYSQWLGPVVTRFLPTEGKRELWLTIDDGPEPEETPAVLDVLDRFDARATFFLIGEKAAAHPELVREIHRRGHQVANHSHRHRQYAFWCLPKKQLRDEIDGGTDILRTALAGEPGHPIPAPIFRSPVGMKPLSLHRLLLQRGHRLIAWTARGRDGTAHPNLDKVITRLSKGAKPGAILLLHEGRGHAPELLERLLPSLQETDFEWVIPDPESLVSGRR